MPSVSVYRFPLRDPLASTNRREPAALKNNSASSCRQFKGGDDGLVDNFSFLLEEALGKPTVDKEVNLQMFLLLIGVYLPRKILDHHVGTCLLF